VVLIKVTRCHPDDSPSLVVTASRSSSSASQVRQDLMYKRCFCSLGGYLRVSLSAFYCVLVSTLLYTVPKTSASTLSNLTYIHTYSFITSCQTQPYMRAEIAQPTAKTIVGKREKFTTKFYHISQHTLCVLLHYLTKLKIHIYCEYGTKCINICTDFIAASGLLSLSITH